MIDLKTCDFVALKTFCGIDGRCCLVELDRGDTREI